MVKKRSRLILFIAIILVVIIILAFVIFLGSQSSQIMPGVKAGDEFVYDVMGLWSSSDPNVTLPEAFLQFNMTEWYKITVTDVSGPKVSINTIWRFTNGTEFTGTGSVNVETGICYPSEGFWTIYASNLKENDLLRPLGPDRSTINETRTRNYDSGVARETNRVSLILQYYDADDPTYTTTWTEYLNIQFDKQTGMLVELRDINVYSNPEQRQTIAWTIRESNVWTVS